MLQQKYIKWVYGLSILFILINAIATYLEFYYLNLIPAAVLVILLALFSIDKLMLLTVFLTPLAINLQHLEGNLGLSLPTEPIIFGIMIIFIFKQLHQANLDIRVMKHPITISIIINLIVIMTKFMTIIQFSYYTM